MTPATGRSRPGRLRRSVAVVSLVTLVASCEAEHAEPLAPPSPSAAATSPPVSAPQRPPAIDSPGRRGQDESRRPTPAARAPGAVLGRVLYRGPLPESTWEYIPEAGRLEAHTIIVEPETGGLKNVCIWLEGVPSTEGAATDERPAVAVLDQERWTFVPHVLAVRAGGEVRFLNSDVANHNVHSSTRGHAFNIGTPVGVESSRRFRRPTGADPIRIECDIHPWMRAWIYVVPHTAFAVTDRSGRFRIADVPPGRFVLRAHHADGGLAASREITVEEGVAASIELVLEGAS